jgi:hypothetical protein
MDFESLLEDSLFYADILAPDTKVAPEGVATLSKHGVMVRKRKRNAAAPRRTPPSVARVVNKLIGQTASGTKEMYDPATTTLPQSNILKMHNSFAQSLLACQGGNPKNATASWAGPVCSGE